MKNFLYFQKNQEGKCGELLRGEMSENEKRKMMDAHNAKRQYVARGEQEGQPGASDMQNLVSTDLLKNTKHLSSTQFF